MKLSVCMMVKNEEANLERCLNSLKNIRSKVSNELIIVDTGSVDRTIEIAKSYDAKVYEHKWNNNFSEMRNISISYAKGEWIMIIDADEEFVEDKAIIEQLNKNNDDINGIAIELQNIINSNGKIGSKIVTMRLFRNDGKFHYKGVVHNLPVVFGNVLKIDALLNHYGYMADDSQLMEIKFERTSKLLIQEIDKDPSNVYYLYQLGTTYDMHNENIKAIEYYHKAYMIVKNDSLLSKENFYLYGAYAKVLVIDGRFEDAINISNEGLLIQKDYIDLMYFGGLSNVILKKYSEGIELINHYLETIDNIKDTEVFNNPNVQLYTINSKIEVLVNLASAYLALKNFDESIKTSTEVLEKLNENSEYYERCVNNYIAACINSGNYSMLNDLYGKITNKRWDNIDVMIYTILKQNEEISINSRNDILSQLPTYLGKLFKSFLSSEIKKENLVEPNLQKNIYYVNNNISEIVLFSVLMEKQCDELFVSVDETKLMTIFSDLIDQYGSFVSEKLRNCIENIDDCKTFNQYFFKRMILKVLALSDFNKESEKNYFEMYINSGLEQLANKYSTSFLNGNSGKQYLNSEEQYFACLYNLRNNFDKSYMHYALEIFPQYNRKTLDWIEKNIGNKKSNVDLEYSDLTELIKKNIHALVEANQIMDALNLIEEYLKVNPKDLDIIILQSELLISRNED